MSGPAILPVATTNTKGGGTANIFAVVAPQAGMHFNRATPDRSARQFALMVRDIVTAYP